MKTFNLLTIILVAILFSCSTKVKTNGKKVDFGIFEMVKPNEIPSNIMDSIKAKNVHLDNDLQSPVIGYISVSDSSVFHLDLSKENLKLVRAYSPVDEAKEYYAIAAIKTEAGMNINDLKKTWVSDNNVNIKFNEEGTKKWAEMTRSNVGRHLAFVIDNQIYSMPGMLDVIKEGIALISGLENESMAKEISESLNACITK
jgi:preprotein translocase subunit SecD